MKFSDVLNNVKNNKLYSLMAVLGFSVIIIFYCICDIINPIL